MIIKEIVNPKMKMHKMSSRQNLKRYQAVWKVHYRIMIICQLTHQQTAHLFTNEGVFLKHQKFKENLENYFHDIEILTLSIRQLTPLTPKSAHKNGHLLLLLQEIAVQLAQRLVAAHFLLQLASTWAMVALLTDDHQVQGQLMKDQDQVENPVFPVVQKRPAESNLR